MGNKVSYNLGDVITQIEAVDFIRRVIYPEERPLKIPGNRIRWRISSAQDKDEVTEEPFIAKDFFSWAIRQKGWSKLKEVEGLPFSASAVVGTGTILLETFQPTIIAYNIPDEYDALRDKYIECRRSCAKLERIVQEKTERIDELEIQLAKKKQHSKKIKRGIKKEKQSR